MVRAPRLPALMLLLVLGGGCVVSIGCGISCLPETASPAASGPCHAAAPTSADATLVSANTQDDCGHPQLGAETTLTTRAALRVMLDQDTVDAHSSRRVASATNVTLSQREHSPPTAAPIAPLRI